jgi:hypothetical protein
MCCLLTLACRSGDAPAGQVQPEHTGARATTDFAETIERLSETGGYFDTDNLISNESSYMHVATALRDSGLSGGAYIGVGPDQSFSYMALLRPDVAYLIDVRRDNLLHHLLYKGLFHEAANRVEFLSLLYGRPAPESMEAWDERSVHEVTAWVDGHPTTPIEARAAHARVRLRIEEFGVPLTEDDWTTIERFHYAFIKPGLDLRFTTLGRTPRFFYPTHRDLLLAEDLDGQPSSYLVREEDYAFLKDLQERNAVIPLVGNLAGEHALLAVGQDAKRRGLAVTALYASNVEFYLWADGSFDRFANNVMALPVHEDGLIIRSYFRGAFREGPPLQRPGFYSAQLLQRIQDFARVQSGDGFRSYGDLVTRDAVPLEEVGSPLW